MRTPNKSVKIKRCINIIFYYLVSHSGDGETTIIKMIENACKFDGRGSSLECR